MLSLIASDRMKLGLAAILALVASALLFNYAFRGSNDKSPSGEQAIHILSGPSAVNGCDPLDAGAMTKCTFSMLTSRLGKPNKYAEYLRPSGNTSVRKPEELNPIPEKESVLVEYVWLNKGVHCSGEEVFEPLDSIPTQWDLNTCEHFKPTTWDTYKAKFLGGLDFHFQDWKDIPNIQF